LWVDITAFVLVVAGGQWLHLRVLLSSQIPAPVPPAVVLLLGLLALLVLYGIWTVTPPGFLFSSRAEPAAAWPRPAGSSVLICRPAAPPRTCRAAARAYVRRTLAKMSQASSDLAVRLKAM
jgi:hypothetical protein